jgi:phospholipid transport system substrate-binding protein
VKRFVTVVAVAVALFAAAPSAQAASGDDATRYIENVAKQALTAISNSKNNKVQKQAALDRLFKNSVDIPWVGRFVLGQSWRQATDDQKSRYLKEYEKFLISHYTSRFTDYTSGTFTITGTQDDGEDEYTVSMELKGDKRNDPPVLVEYRVRRDSGSFKIFDVIVEGVSLITTQRSEFTAVVNQHDIEYLITQLKNKAIPIATTATR